MIKLVKPTYNDEINKLVELSGAKRVFETSNWNGKTIYLLDYENRYIGVPNFIIEENGKYRLSTYKETFEYLREN